ncbi:hypothetical protein HID58_014394 [Brassica napus]|uniref:Uncharacterized protein n=1 Tax=Brassica napus TaxID=3708 RepID=A0ABQ8DH52_BRANA|nr:hypothetical protein HID58_014394 [Brassica napus]
MANSRVFFSDWKTGGCSSVVEARLLRFWEPRNVKRGGEIMWDDVLLIDVNLPGEITAVKSTVNEPPEDKNRVVATIKMEK